MQNLDGETSLREQIHPEGFSHPFSPNWQDHSTTAECELIEKEVGGAEALATLTGSKAHHVHTLSNSLTLEIHRPANIEISEAVFGTV